MKYLFLGLVSAISSLTPAASFAAEVFPCELVFAEDISAGSQKRLRTFVFSDATTADDRAATAVAAARSIQVQSGMDYVEVALIPNAMPRERDELSHGTGGGIVKYAPDPSKIPFMDRVWEIEASEAPLTDPSDYTWDHSTPPSGTLAIRRVESDTCSPVYDQALVE